MYRVRVEVTEGERADNRYLRVLRIHDIDRGLYQIGFEQTLIDPCHLRLGQYARTQVSSNSYIRARNHL